MSDTPIDRRSIFTSRQAAHALGVPATTLDYMRLNGDISPTWRLPGQNGAYLYERAEIVRVLNQSNRRTFKRRRLAASKTYKLDGLQPVMPRPNRRGHLPPPPPREVKP